MKNNPSDLPESVPPTPLPRPETVAEYERGIRERDMEIEYLREQILLLRARLYGTKSEKLRSESGAEQLEMFELDEKTEDEAPAAEPESVEVPAHRRKKSGRAPLPADLPRREVVHDVSEAEKICACGAEKVRIGEETSEKLELVPAELNVVRHIRPKYACSACEGVEGDGPTVVVAPPPEQILPKSQAGASLLAHVAASKFADSIPLYRQERQFERLGLLLNRATMANWLLKLAEACKELSELCKQEILSGALLHVDETTVQVLDEPGREPQSKSHMWVLRGGPPDKPGVWFHYDVSRGTETAKDLLAGYSGCVVSDGYAAYDFLDHTEGVRHAACWAHVRRKFAEVLKALGKTKKGGKVGEADKALAWIRKLYAVEKTAAGLSPAETVAKRRAETAPLLEEFHSWLLKKQPQTPPKSLLGKAVNYTLGQWPRLKVFLDDGLVPPDNNAAENAIRPFVVGRKNWLFSKSVGGASASALFYGLVETAKANGLEPFGYLWFLFEELPKAKNQEAVRALLPQNLSPSDVKLP